MFSFGFKQLFKQQQWWVVFRSVPPPPPLGGIRDLPNASPQGPLESLKLEALKKILGFRLVGFPAARGLSLIVSIFSIIRSMGFRRSSLASWRAKHVRIRSKNKLFQHNGEPWRRSLHQHPRRSKWRGFEQCSNQPGHPSFHYLHCVVVFLYVSFNVVLKEITKSPFVHGVKNHQALPFTCSPEINIAPENWWLECYFPFWESIFSGATMLVSGRVFRVSDLSTSSWVKPRWSKAKT